MSEYANEQFGDLLNDIGAEAVGLTGSDDARVLIYAEIGEGTEAMLFVYNLPGENCIRSPEDPTPVTHAIRRAWEFSRSQGPAACWKGMTYLVENGKMNVDLHYDDVSGDPLLIDKGDELMARHFPGMPYSD